MNHLIFYLSLHSSCWIKVQFLYSCCTLHLHPSSNNGLHDDNSCKHLWTACVTMKYFIVSFFPYHVYIASQYNEKYLRVASFTIYMLNHSFHSSGPIHNFFVVPCQDSSRSHTMVEYWQEEKRCSIDSSVELHRGHILSSINFHFFNISIVYIFPCRERNKMKFHLTTP